MDHEQIKEAILYHKAPDKVMRKSLSKKEIKT